MSNTRITGKIQVPANELAKNLKTPTRLIN